MKDYSGVPFFARFFLKDPFLPGFFSSEKAKKGHLRISEEKMTNISDYVFLSGSFFNKRVKYLLIFLCIGSAVRMKIQKA